MPPLLRAAFGRADGYLIIKLKMKRENLQCFNRLQ
jgi:hypothetical protein